MDIFVYNMLIFWYNIAIIFIMGRFLYYTNKGKKEYLFTYLLLAAIISFLCMLVQGADLSLGFAIGIFAIFGIIRYRTTPISPREMTYIFLSAGIAAKNTLVHMDLEFYKLLVTDISILLIAGLLEYFLFREKKDIKYIAYDNLELIHPERREELFKDLDSRYGIREIHKIKTGKIDAIKNSVRLQIFFHDSADENFSDE
jgi:hypothetical protein